MTRLYGLKLLAITPAMSIACLVACATKDDTRDSQAVAAGGTSGLGVVSGGTAGRGTGGVSEESGAAKEPPPPDIPVDKLFKDLTAADIAAWCSWLSALKQARADECSELYEPAFDARAQCDRAVSFCTYPWSELVRCVSKTHMCLRRDGVDATMPDGSSRPSCLTPQGTECGPDIETECNTLVHCGGGPQ